MVTGMVPATTPPIRVKITRDVVFVSKNNVPSVGGVRVIYIHSLNS